jgi:D-sedoheptulose 7-phosphate isomerase
MDSQLLKQHFTSYRAKINDLFDGVDQDSLAATVGAIIKTFKSGGCLYVCGNGGSASTASHFVADFSFYVRYFTQFRPRMRALTDNVALMTAIGNDNSFDDVFMEQMRNHFQKEDTVVCISASGNSENVVRAAAYANEVGGTSVAFVGFRGGKLKDTCKIAIHTENPKGDYGPIEDFHLILNHLIVSYLVKDEEFLGLA